MIVFASLPKLLLFPLTFLSFCFYNEVNQVTQAEGIEIMKVTTKTGDWGETSISTKRVLKSSQVIDTMGELDELMAFFIVFASEYPIYLSPIQAIVADCSTICAILAQYKKTEDFTEIRISWLESEITRLDCKQFNFTYPFHDSRLAKLNTLRTITRRVERSLWKYHETTLPLSPIILIYFNRLSDYIYLLSTE